MLNAQSQDSEPDFLQSGCKHVHIASLIDMTEPAEQDALDSRMEWVDLLIESDGCLVEIRNSGMDDTLVKDAVRVQLEKHYAEA
jgi:hypothetical protein